MDDPVDVIELFESFRDQAAILAERFSGESTKAVRMRCYLMGMSDAYASAIAMMVNGDPNLAMEANSQDLIIRFREREGYGEED